jgi:hypothetical protein
VRVAARHDCAVPCKLIHGGVKDKTLLDSPQVRNRAACAAARVRLSRLRQRQDRQGKHKQKRAKIIVFIANLAGRRLRRETYNSNRAGDIKSPSVPPLISM